MPEKAAEADWAEILTTMESDLERLSHEDTELMTAGMAGTQSWAAPMPTAPIPSELVVRARLVIERQQEAIHAMHGEISTTGRHLAALRSIPVGTPGGGAVYLDVTG